MRTFAFAVQTARNGRLGKLTRRPPIAPAETAHRSNPLCHVANICLRPGPKVA